MNILVIGPSWVGDMIMSHALYQQLKVQYPDCQIDVMAPDWCRPLLARMPEVHKAISMPIGHGAFRLVERYRLGKSLRNQYDMAIILPNSFKSALIPFFAKIPVRRGWKGEFRYGLLNDLRANKNDYPMMVQRYVALSFEKGQVPTAQFTAALSSPANTSGRNWGNKSKILTVAKPGGKSPYDWFLPRSRVWTRKTLATLSLCKIGGNAD